MRFKVAPDFENPIDVGGKADDNIYEVSVLADDGNGSLTPQTILVTVSDVATSVVERNIFYNNSKWDLGSNGLTDVDAIASDKTPLLDGQVATFGNYTSYSKGINGIIITVTDLNRFRLWRRSPTSSIFTLAITTHPAVGPLPQRRPV